MVESVTSLSVTEEVAASGAVALSTAEFVLAPDDGGAGAGAGVETASGTFLSKPCWLTVLDTDDWKENQQKYCLHLKTARNTWLLSTMATWHGQLCWNKICGYSYTGLKFNLSYNKAKKRLLKYEYKQEINVLMLQTLSTNLMLCTFFLQWVIFRNFKSVCAIGWLCHNWAASSHLCVNNNTGGHELNPQNSISSAKNQK